MVYDISKRQQPHLNGNVSPRPPTDLQLTTRYPYTTAGPKTSLYTGTAKRVVHIYSSNIKIKVKMKQDVQRPNVSDLGQAQNIRRG